MGKRLSVVIVRTHCHKKIPPSAAPITTRIQGAIFQNVMHAVGSIAIIAIGSMLRIIFQRDMQT